MRRALFALAAVSAAIALVAPVAQADGSIRHKTVKKFGRHAVIRYAHLHRKWAHRAGRDVVGRQIVKFGMPKRGPGNRVATHKEWRRTMAVFRRWEHPGPPPPVVMTAGTQPSTAPYGGQTGNSTLDSIAQCESGGDPTAIGGGGSFRGKYQFTYGTWQSVGGSGDPAAAPEEEQDRRAAILLARSGTGPWPVCGG